VVLLALLLEARRSEREQVGVSRVAASISTAEDSTGSTA
jgi:hypothetical protein